MRLLIIGSTSSIGKYLAKKARRDGIQVLSLGRSHCPEAEYEFDLQSKGLAELEFDLGIYLLADYECISNREKFIKNNNDLMMDYMSKIEGKNRVLYLASDSAFEGVSSSYGLMKRSQESLANEIGLQILRIGWFDVKENGNFFVRVGLKLSKLIFARFTPKTRSLFINITLGEDLWNEILIRMGGDSCRSNVYSKTVSVTFFLTGREITQRTKEISLQPLFKLLFCFKRVLPRQLVKAIDSAATLVY